MLSLFPSFLSFQQIGPFLIRFTLGLIFLHWASKNLRNRNSKGAFISGILDLVLGGLLVVGLYTQLAALVAAIMFFIKMVFKVRSKAFFTDGVNYYFILFIMSVSLLFLGAGVFAFDLPL